MISNDINSLENLFYCQKLEIRDFGNELGVDEQLFKIYYLLSEELNFDAVKELSQIETDVVENNGLYKACMAKFAMNEKRYSDAYDIFSSALEDETTSGNKWLLYEFSHYLLINGSEKYENIINLIIRENQRFIPGLLDKTTLFAERNEQDSILELFSFYLQEDYSKCYNIDACNYIGTAFYVKEDYIKAKEWYTKGLSTKPNSYSFLGLAIIEDTVNGDFEKAYEYYLAAIDLDYYSVDAHEGLFEFLLEYQEYELLRKHLQDAVDLETSDTELFLVICLFYLRLEDDGRLIEFITNSQSEITNETRSFVKKVLALVRSNAAEDKFKELEKQIESQNELAHLNFIYKVTSPEF